MAEPLKKPVYDNDYSEEPVIRPDLKALEGGGETTPRERGHLGVVSGKTNKSVSPDEIKDQEESAEPPKTEESTTAEDSPFNYRQDDTQKGRFKLFGGKFSGKTSSSSKLKKRLLIASGLGSVMAIAAIIAVALFLISSLKLQDLATHIEEYNMTRVFRDYKNTEEDSIAESIGKDEAGAGEPSLVDALEAKYGALRDQTWGKLDAIRPQKIIDNLQDDGRIQYVYNEVPRGGLTGGTKLELDSVVIDGTTIQAPTTSLNIFSNFGENVRFSRQVSDALEQATPETFGLIRSGAVTKLLDGLGIKLNLCEKACAAFQGKDSDEAFAEEQAESFDRVYEPAKGDSIVDGINQTSEDASTDLKKLVDDGDAEELSGSRVSQLAENLQYRYNGFKDSVKTSIDSAVSQDAQNVIVKGLSYFSGAYQIAFPVCLVYDGSLVNNPNMVDTKSTELQREGLLVISASDQTKAGEINGEARGAFDKKLGDISTSVPEVRAQLSPGQTVDTSAIVAGPDRPQASSTGSLNTSAGDIITTLFGSNIITQNLSSVVKSVCPYITSPPLIIATALGQFGLTVLSGGGDEAVEAPAQAGVDALAEDLATQTEAPLAEAAAGEAVAGTTLVSDTPQQLLSLRQKMTGFMTKVGLQTVALGGITLLARLDVLSHMNGNYTGLDANADLGTQADMGVRLNAQEIERQTMMGRPETSQEVVQDYQLDQQELAKNKSHQSIYERYLALKNPDSLATTVGTSLLSKTGTLKAPGVLLASMANVFKTFVSDIGSMISLPWNNKAMAATVPNNDYGIIQWGWSQDENNLVETDPSYGILANAEYWNHEVDPATQTAIQNTYGPCFTDSIGTLLSNGKLVRDNTGNITDGDCSPTNLGVNNPTYGDKVFRWRLLGRDNNALDNLNDIQSASASTPGSTN